MSFVGTIKNEGASLGLFSYGTGIIRNVKIQQATIVATITSDNNRNESNVYCGALFGGVGSRIMIFNCAVEENSVFSINNTTSGDSSVGGLVGKIYLYADVYIDNCENSANIYATTNNFGNVYAGGFVGSHGESAVMSSFSIKNCINSGDICVTKTTDSIDRMGSGGITGYMVGGSMINCINNGNVSANITEPDYTASVGGLVGIGSVDTIVNITNSYALEIFNSYGEICTIEQLNSKFFYTETLGWSEDIWDFSELDVENGKYPKLKK
jgi:hypothetical protein